MLKFSSAIVRNLKNIVNIFIDMCLFLQDVMFFANTPPATWPQFGEMLSWQFLSATKRGLDEAQLEMITHRLFGKYCFSVQIS